MTVFEKIINREIPAYIIYEDEIAIAFLDISQATKGHTLVVPKEVYENIFEIPTDILKHLIEVTKKVSEAINKAFNPLGINILNNNGAAAGQTVFHYHIHILPRYSKNDIDLKFTNFMDKISKDDYEKRAKAIRKALL